jgi:hypothetical protein
MNVLGRGNKRVSNRFPLRRKSKNGGSPPKGGTTPSATGLNGNLDLIRRTSMGRGILLWLLGVPIPIIILLALIAR